MSLSLVEIPETEKSQESDKLISDEVASFPAMEDFSKRKGSVL
jgi:hypothetical protein